ncbi:MAG: lytic murein transglycosylase [Desulfobacterales bacterium]|nr:lytic murein transglycosylase [Desulfobacterales bacterium]
MDSRLKRTMPGGIGRGLRWLGLVLAGILLMGAAPNSDYFVSLKKRLVGDGFDQDRIGDMFARPEAEIAIDGVSLFFRHSEARLDYNQFLRPKRISMARRYLAAHAAELNAAHERYGVAPEVITAILLVETNLGGMSGRQKVFNILATMAALEGRAARESFWATMPTEKRISRKKFNAKADRKSRWAYLELKALLKYVSREDLDPLTLQGSYAGAMGYCQFMPSNALKLGVDGNGDGRVDLYDHADAIASVGNYLKHHGWRPELSHQKRYKVILKYNYSKPYANTILKIADKLKG